MRTTIQTLFCFKIFLLCLFGGQLCDVHGEESDSQSIQIVLNLGEIIEFAEGNDDVAAILQKAIQEATDGVRIQDLDEAIVAANDVVGMDIRKDVHSLSVNLGSGFSLKGDFALDVAPVYAVLHTAKQGNFGRFAVDVTNILRGEVSRWNVACHAGWSQRERLPQVH